MIAELDITDFIPQRPPMVMISHAQEIWESGVSTKFLVQKGHLFCHEGYLSASGIIENIAQTAAFFAGYSFKNAGKEVPLGFISSIKSLAISEFPQQGATITTKVEKIQDVMDFTIFKGTVFNEDSQEIAQCELRIFIQHAENTNDQ